MLESAPTCFPAPDISGKSHDFEAPTPDYAAASNAFLLVRPPVPVAPMPPCFGYPFLLNTCNHPAIYGFPTSAFSWILHWLHKDFLWHIDSESHKYPGCGLPGSLPSDTLCSIFHCYGKLLFWVTLDKDTVSILSLFAPEWQQLYRFPLMFSFSFCRTSSVQAASKTKFLLLPWMFLPESGNAWIPSALKIPHKFLTWKWHNRCLHGSFFSSCFSHRLSILRKKPLFDFLCHISVSATHISHKACL